MNLPNNNIKTVAGIVINGNYNFGPIFNLYDKVSNNSLDAFTPDVTISYLDTGTIQVPLEFWTITYTFKIEDKTTKQLMVQQEDFNDIYSGNSYNSNLIIRHNFNSADLIGRPRIASPDNAHGGAPYKYDDYTIVLDVIPDPGILYNYGIYTYNQHFGVWNDYNYQQNQISTNYEGTPVVAYAGDIIIIAWTIDAWTGNIYGLVNYDVIQRQLFYDASPGTNYCSRVNLGVSKNQYIPSVASNYSYEVLYSFFDENIDQIRYKESTNSNQYLRLSKDKIIYDIYPNPATNVLNINIENDAECSIYDINGRNISNKMLKEGTNIIDINNIKPGVYIVKLFYSNSIVSKKIVIY